MIPLSAQMFILLTVFFLMVAYHARLVEVTSRLDFLWKQQAERELNDMQETRHNNTQLLKNILPDHVAQHFLSNERNCDVSKDFIEYLSKKLVLLFVVSAGIVFSIQTRSGSNVCEYSKLYRLLFRRC